VSRTVFIPDTNFFIDHPDFVRFFAPSRALVHVDLVFPVLCELDDHRRKRNEPNPRLKEKGMKADIAIQLIRQLQQTEPDGIEFEVYNPRGIDSSLRPDAQIVEHVVRLAAEHHPQDVIVFITNDKGLPTIMFLDEKKRRNLRHVVLKNAEDVQRELRICGNPLASIDHVGLSPKPLTVDDQSGINILIRYTITDFRYNKVWVALHFFPAEATTEECVFCTVDVPTVVHREECKLFLPFSQLRLRPRRQGMYHVKLIVRIWDAEQSVVLAEDDNSCLEFVMGNCYLTKH